MKIILALAVLVSGFAAKADYVSCPGWVPAWQCDHVNPNPIDHYPERDMPGHQPPYDRGHAISCAPEVVKGNVAATERTLNTLIATPEFKSATVFKKSVSFIASQKAASAKVELYFSLIGIDSRDSKAVAEFMGARDVRGAWLGALEKNAGLNAAQSTAVASKLQTALRGSLQ